MTKRHARITWRGDRSELRARVGVVDLGDQPLQFVAAPIELDQQLGWALGRLLVLLGQHASGQAVLELCDPLLQVGPTVKCFSND